MGQPRTPKVDWLLEAWNLSATLANVPTKPLKLGSLGRVPLDESVDSYLAGLQTRLNQFLNYFVAMKLGAGKAKTLPGFDGVDSRSLITTRNALMRSGMDFDDRATAAISAHANISFIRRYCYLDDSSRIALPVIMVAISGKSAALQNAVAASRPRASRENQLREDKLAAMKKHGGESWKEIANRLGGEGRISYWDEKVIYWRDDSGNQKETRAKTFQEWKP